MFAHQSAEIETLSDTVRQQWQDIDILKKAVMRQRGLMRKTAEQIPENWGMLFVFRDAEYLGFWMRDTWVPLSIAYIDDDGKILQISDMKPKDERSVESKHKVRYALEMNRGWFDRAGAKVGTVIPQFREKVEPFLRVAERREVAR